MTNYLHITLTTEQAHHILELVERFGAPVEGGIDWAIEREVDGALLAHEMETDVEADSERERMRALLIGVGINPAAVLEGEYDDESPDADTCCWLMEDFDEDGPTVRVCGRQADPERGLCEWHTSAMALDDMEFEARVEAGETWSR